MRRVAIILIVVLIGIALLVGLRPLSPARTANDYRLKAKDTTGSVLSSVETARLAARVGSGATPSAPTCRCWLAATERRLTERREHTPSRIDFALVREIGSAIAIAADGAELDNNRAERWIRDVIVDKIPGAGHAAE